MTTEAGKRLLALFFEDAGWPIDPETEIAAIEAETIEMHEAVLRARGWRDEYEAATDAAMNYGDGQAAERARIAEAVRGKSVLICDCRLSNCPRVAALLAIVEACEHDWQRSGPVSDGHLFCPNCGGHEDER